MSVSVHDRGFNYGDGLFETMLVCDGEPIWWDAHYARLRRGCEALRIACPASGDLLAQARGFIASAPPPHAQRRAALKLVLTRGVGGRGYVPPRDATPSIVWSLHEAPAPSRGGIAVRWCELRLSQQPALAGLKHLNRLENVLARGEWDDPGIAEGLLRDAEDHVVCATAANLFVVRDGRSFTPLLDRCGVAGVTRAWVMRQATVVEARLSAQDIESADELFLTASLRGILPVARLGAREWNVGPMTRRLQGMLHDEVSAL
jgi:4-amino-4-deoxychorismate lyase